ncbi:MAG: hypothetical protein KKD18_02685 [Nanoarchaeota archaeon]|nr:hypothetical protein [Nanoarchaeota archaeon]
MVIKKNILYTAGILILLALAGFLIGSGRGVTGSVVNLPSGGDVQVVKLYVGNTGDYVLEPSELKREVKVRLEADMTRMPGCSRSIVIPAFGVSKTFTTSDNSVEFVPDKAGTFNIACSMNMYRGTFTVLDESGKKSNYVEQKLSSPSGGSCGVGGGGCGCGG